MRKEVFTAAPAYNWIGRAPFSGDNYLKQTLVTDFRLYDEAVSDEVVSTLASQLTALEDAYTHGELVGDTVATVFFGDKLSLTASDAFGWSTATEWDNGQTGTTANYGHITTERTIQTYILSQGERKEPVNFHIRLKYIEPRIIRNGTIYQDTTHIVVSTGDMVTLQPYVPTAVGPVSYQ